MYEARETNSAIFQVREDSDLDKFLAFHNEKDKKTPGRF